MSRPPTFFERYYLIRGEYDYYTNFNVSAQYNHPIVKENLSHALRNLIAKNPCFAVNFFRVNDRDIAEDAHNFVLRGLELVKFDDVVAFKTISKFDGSTLEYIDQLVVHADQKLPLFRVLVLDVEGTDEQYVTFYCNHALFDGTSGSLFHDKLLFELNEVEQTSGDLKFVQHLHTLSDSFELPQVNAAGLEIYNPSITFMLHEFVSRLIVPGWVKSYLASTYNKWFPADLHVDLDPWTNPRYSYKPTRKGTPTKFKLLRFSPTEVARMLSRCKKNGLTLTPYTLVIASQCLQETIMKRTEQEIASISKTYPIVHSSETIVPINNRRYLPKAHAEEIGLMLSLVEVPLPPFKPFTNLKELYPLMKHVADVMSEGIETQYGSKLIGVLQYSSVGDFLKGMLGKLNSRLTVDLSNLGNCNYSHGSWQVENLVFSQSQGMGTHFGVYMISTLKLGMNLSFAYLEEYAEFPEEIERFVKLYRLRLLLEDD